MTLTRLIYSSQISDDFEHHDIKKILAIANKRNHQKGISGLLVFDHKSFLQCLQGPRLALRKMADCSAEMNSTAMLYYVPITALALAEPDAGLPSASHAAAPRWSSVP